VSKAHRTLPAALLALALLAMTPGSRAQERKDPARERLLAVVQGLLDRGDTFLAIEHVLGLGDDRVVAHTYIAGSLSYSREGG